MARQIVGLDKQFKGVFNAIEDMVKDPKEKTMAYNKILKRGSLPLAAAMRKNVMLSGVDYSSVRLKKDIKARTPGKAVKRKLGYPTWFPMITVGPRVKKPKSKDKEKQRKMQSEHGFYWHWYEYGTKDRYTKKGQFRGKIKPLRYGEKTYPQVQSTLNNLTKPTLDRMYVAFDKTARKYGIRIT